MIFGGPTTIGTLKNSRKAYARDVMHIIREAPKLSKTEVIVAFDDSDLEDMKFPYDNPLVITSLMGNF